MRIMKNVPSRRRIMLSALAFLGAAFAVAVVPSFTTPADAGEAQAPRAVIELFTSQGCSSCPPADAKIVALARDPDVIALTLHVDYWDYLGWQDTLASPAFSERQRGYAETRGDRGVFTPQMVINGREACIGSDPQAIHASLRQATREHERLPVPMRVSRDGTRLDITLEGDHPAAAELWLLIVEPDMHVAIKRGENKGRTAHYANVVRQIIHLDSWDGTAGEISVSLPDAGDGFVVLLQELRGDYPGAILGAARGEALAGPRS